MSNHSFDLLMSMVLAGLSPTESATDLNRRLGPDNTGIDRLRAELASTCPCPECVRARNPSGPAPQERAFAPKESVGTTAPSPVEANDEKPRPSLTESELLHALQARCEALEDAFDDFEELWISLFSMGLELPDYTLTALRLTRLCEQLNSEQDDEQLNSEQDDAA